MSTSGNVATRPETGNYDYFEEDDNFSDNPLAQSSTAAGVQALAGDLGQAVANAIRSSNTFNLQGEDLFEEEGDYGEEDEEEEDEDEDDDEDEDEDEEVSARAASSDNAMHRQNSSADVTSSLVVSGSANVDANGNQR